MTTAIAPATFRSSGANPRAFVNIPESIQTLEEMRLIRAGGLRVGVGKMRVEIHRSGIEVFNAAGVSVVEIQPRTPLMRIGANTPDIPPLLLDNQGSLQKIVTSQIETDAASAIESASGDDGTPTTVALVPTWTDLVSVNVTVDGATDVILIASSGEVHLGAGETTVSLQVRRDSTFLTAMLVHASGPACGTHVDLAPSAGSHTYTLRATAAVTTDSTCLYNRLLAFQRKR